MKQKATYNIGNNSHIRETMRRDHLICEIRHLRRRSKQSEYAQLYLKRQPILSSIFRLPSQQTLFFFPQTMFSSLLRSLPQLSLPQLGRRWKPLNFSNPNFVRIPEWHKIEEETLPDYIASQYYPTRIGEVIKERYQVIGKLGFGSTSTVWLARDIE